MSTNDDRDPGWVHMRGLSRGACEQYAKELNLCRECGGHAAMVDCMSSHYGWFTVECGCGNKTSAGQYMLPFHALNAWNKENPDD